MTLDVVYLYKRSRSDELRYSLRSLTNLADVDRVFIVGDPPPFPYRNLEVIPHRHVGDTGQAIARNHLAVATAQSSPVGRRFYLFNDDFFITAPISHVPLYHRGLMEDIDRNHTHEGLPTADDYIYSEIATGYHLEDHYAVTPYSFALHLPMPVVKSSARRILFAMTPDLRFRTMYGNLDFDAHEDGGERTDCKTRRTDVALADIPPPFASTYDKSWQYGQIGRDIEALFPDPSQYEA